MIAYEREREFVMVTQHHHALASGEMADRWKAEYFIGKEKRKEVIWSISQHDRGWIDLDNTPFWNDATRKPYTFIDFPLVPKLSFYRKGVDEVEAESLYGGLLCSMHYVSFLQGTSEEAALAYVRDEKARQLHLKEKLGIREAEQAELDFHFELLQFCDNLSLYMCLQEPGITKEQEVGWYRNGFPQKFTFSGGKKIIPRWLNRKTACLAPFPFEEEFAVSVPFKEVSKDEIRQVGLAQAYQKAQWKTRDIAFVL